MSLRELVVGSTQMLVESVLRRINENLLDYFINLPESIWVSGFLDQVNLKDVMFNTKALSKEWYSLDIPFRLKYGHIRRASIQVLLAHSKLVMEVDGVVLIIGPNISNKSYEEVIKNTMDNVSGLLELFRNIITIKNNNDDACGRLGSSKEESFSDGLHDVRKSSKEGLNSLLRWLFRYVPDLSLTVRNIYIRYEDDVLDVSHPMSAGIHIDSLTINPARSCWDIEWPTENNNTVRFVSNDKNDPVNLQRHPLSITNIDFDTRGIFGIKIKGFSAYWDDESAPFIPISLIEQTEFSKDKFGVFSAVTIDDMQNLVDSNLEYHTSVISNMSISAQFGFVNLIQGSKCVSEKNGTMNTGSEGDGASSPPGVRTISSSIGNGTENKNGSLTCSDTGDFSIGSNIATLININIHSGFEVNVYPQMVHGLVRMITLYNLFQFWTQIRRFRPVERPGSGSNREEIRKICREWWLFSLKYYKSMFNKENKHTGNLKDEIDYRIERKKYIKIIKKWKWLEYIISSTNSHFDSCSNVAFKRTWLSNNTNVLKAMQGKKKGISDTSVMFEDISNRHLNASFPISYLDNGKNVMAGSSKGAVVGIGPNGGGVIKVDSEISSLIGNNKLNLSKYWEHNVEFLQKIAKRSEDVKFVLGVLQHHTYWTISQWHILAEREYNLEFELLQNSVSNTKKDKSKSNDCLTLLAYGLHCQPESNIWDLINRMSTSYENLKRYVIKYLDTKNKDIILISTDIFNNDSNSNLSYKIGKGSNTSDKSADEKIAISHPYVIFRSNDDIELDFNILTDFFGVNTNSNAIRMGRRDWHSIRLRLHLWGKFYDEYLKAFPLSITETIEIRKLMYLSYYLDFQQMDKLFSASFLSDSLNLSNLISHQNEDHRVFNQIDGLGLQLDSKTGGIIDACGVGNVVTVAKPKNQQNHIPEREYTGGNLAEGKYGHDGTQNTENNIRNNGNDTGAGRDNTNDMGREEDNNGNMSFKYEKKLPDIYNENKNVPEWLNDMAGPGICLPKLLSNKIIKICLPRCDVNICHLVRRNKEERSEKGTKLSRNLFCNDSNKNKDYETSYTTRKLFGLVISNFGFNMNTCTSLRLSCCLKKLELLLWNYNDSNLLGEFISSIKLDKTVGKKMTRDDQIVIFSICDPRIDCNREESGNTDVSGDLVFKTPVRGSTNKDECGGYLNSATESIEVMSESSPTLIHHVEDSTGRVLGAEKTVRFDNNSFKLAESCNLSGLMSTLGNNNNNRYLKRWNYLSLVVLPPNNSTRKEMTKKMSGSDEDYDRDYNGGNVSSTSEKYSNFVFKIPFYLKLDLNLTSVMLILNEMLLDNMRGEVMKLIQVYLLTLWSQYKGFGSFPFSDKMRYNVNEIIHLYDCSKMKERSNFELLLCHPFNLPLNKSNISDRFNKSEWDKINSLLNKVHIRVSIRLPSVEMYMLNESIDYFYENSDIEKADRKSLSFDLSTSSKLLIESQTVLIGTLIDKSRGNMNRIYFRGFQTKFDTQQNIASIIKLYLRFKNLITDRYDSLVGIMNLFKGERFEYISKHSLTSFTNEILRLQREKLPDTNNILLKEFSLSVENNDGETTTEGMHLSFENHDTAAINVSIEMEKQGSGHSDSNNSVVSMYEIEAKQNEDLGVRSSDQLNSNTFVEKLQIIRNTNNCDDYKESTSTHKKDSSLSRTYSTSYNNTAATYYMLYNMNKDFKKELTHVSDDSNNKLTHSVAQESVSDIKYYKTTGSDTLNRKSSKLVSRAEIECNKDIISGKGLEGDNGHKLGLNIEKANNTYSHNIVNNYKPQPLKNCGLNIKETDIPYNSNQNVDSATFVAEDFGNSLNTNDSALKKKNDYRKKKPTVSLRTGLNFYN